VNRPAPPASGLLAGRDDAGFAAGFEGLLFGLLIFVAGTLLIAYAWGVVDTKTATGEAARQAARTYVEAPDAPAAAAGADQAASAALAGYGRDPSRATVALVGGTFSRCGRVTIAVSYPAPLLELPFVGSIGRAQAVRSEHSELVDPFRTGLPGTSSCG
jgi:hypothetical protein